MCTGSCKVVPGCDQDESPANKWELFRDGVMHGQMAFDEDGQADVGHGTIDWQKLMPAIKARDFNFTSASDAV